MIEMYNKRVLYVILTIVVLVTAVNVLAPPPVPPAWDDYLINYPLAYEGTFGDYFILYNLDDGNPIGASIGYNGQLGIAKFFAVKTTGFDIMVWMNKNYGWVLIIAQNKTSGGRSITIIPMFEPDFCKIYVTVTGIPERQVIPVNITVSANNYDDSISKSATLVSNYFVGKNLSSNWLFNGTSIFYVRDGYDYGADIKMVRFDFYKRIRIGNDVYEIESIYVNGSSNPYNYVVFDDIKLNPSYSWNVSISYRKVVVENTCSENEPTSGGYTIPQEYTLIVITVVIIAVIAIVYLLARRRLNLSVVNYIDNSWVES